MLRDASVLVIGSIDWDFNWQNPQETSCALAAAGARVPYVENTGTRTVGLRDVSRLAARLRHWSHGRRPAKERHGVEVLSPVLVPAPYSRAARAINSHLLIASVRRWLRSGSARLLVIVTFLPTPLVHSIIDALDPDLVVYYCIDRLSESSKQARALIPWEDKLLRRADLVLVTSSSLYEMAAGCAQRVEMLTSGVRIAEYDDAREKTGPLPPALREVRTPVIGFVGTIRDSTDIRLVADVASRARDLTFVLFGPHMTDVSALERQPNVILPGAIGYRAVVDHVVRFDIGILPYALTSFTASIMPVKLKEYLAAGIPVVSTSLPEVVAFAQQYPGVVTFADDPVRFEAALRQALNTRDSASIARRTAVAHEFDWGRQMQHLCELVDSSLSSTLGPTEPLAVR